MVPGKKDTGTNTEISTSDVATTALDTSFMAAEVAVCGSVLSVIDVSLHVFDDHDGVIDHESRGQRDAEQRQRVDGETEDLDEGERTDQRNRDGDRRNDGGAPVQQEEEDHDDDDEDRFFQGGDHFSHRVANHGRGVEGDDVLDAGRERLRQLGQRRFRLFVHVECVGIRELLNTDANGFVSAVHQVRVVALGPDLGAPNVFQLNDSVAGVLEDDVLEFVRDPIGGRRPAA